MSMTMTRRMAARVAVAALMTAGLAAQAPKYADLDIYTLGDVPYREPSAADVKANRAKPAQFPAWLLALNGRAVTMRGYMLPYEANAATVSEFMLIANQQTCCFAPPTSVTEWVEVTVKGNGRVYASQGEIVVRGTFSVGEQFDKAGYVSSIFRIAADVVDSAPTVSRGH